MSRRRIVVMGGGFAGLAALWHLRHAGAAIERLLIDPGAAAVFRPLLPDIVGRGLPPAALATPYAPLAARWGFTHRRARVVTVEQEAGRILCDDGARLDFDVLIVATGAPASFFGRDDLRPLAIALDSIEEAMLLAEAVRSRPEQRFVVAGGGYTGVEIATHLRVAQRRAGGGGEVVIVESAPTLCHGLPEPFRRYLGRRLEEIGIRLITGARVTAADGEGITLKDGARLAPARLVWSAGVAVGEPARSLGTERTAQGRVKVNDRLQAAGNIFVAGDAAAVTAGRGVLRMAVPFAIGQGHAAAHNALRLLRGRALRPYRPCDPGYVVPLAQGRGCGMVLGVPLYGCLTVALHLAMCAYRSGTAANRLTVLRHALRGLNAER
jgi:NADH dehydrogenase